MPDFGHGRDLTPPLRQAGAQNIGEVRIATPVQQVQVIDDARNLIEPIPSPQVGVSRFVVAAGGQRAVMTLRCVAPRGTYMLAFGSNQTIAQYFVSAAAPSGLGAFAVPTDLTGARFGDLGNVNEIAIGDTADTGNINNTPFIDDGSEVFPHWVGEPLYVAAGRFVTMQGVVVDQNNTLVMHWREIL
ncbi:MAG: hypothetical protein V3T07_09715 [Myxococcota bacterium]